MLLMAAVFICTYSRIPRFRFTTPAGETERLWFAGCEKKLVLPPSLELLLGLEPADADLHRCARDSGATVAAVARVEVRHEVKSSDAEGAFVLKY